MSVFIFAVIGIGVIALVSSLFTSATREGQLISDTDQARRTAKEMVNELRNATTSNTGAFAFSQAENQNITFYSNHNGTNVVKKIRYYIQNGSLYKATTIPAGTPLTYSSANETIEVVQRNISNGVAPLFYYYDDSYDGTTDNYLSQPVNLNNIKYIKINFIIPNKAGLTDAARITITDSATIRSLKDNLGN